MESHFILEHCQSTNATCNPFWSSVWTLAFLAGGRSGVLYLHTKMRVRQSLLLSSVYYVTPPVYLSLVTFSSSPTPDTPAIPNYLLSLFMSLYFRNRDVHSKMIRCFPYGKYWQTYSYAKGVSTRKPWNFILEAVGRHCRHFSRKGDVFCLGLLELQELFQPNIKTIGWRAREVDGFPGGHLPQNEDRKWTKLQSFCWALGEGTLEKRSKWGQLPVVLKCPAGLWVTAKKACSSACVWVTWWQRPLGGAEKDGWRDLFHPRSQVHQQQFLEVGGSVFCI